MTNFAEVVRQNPKAAKELDAMKETMDTLRALREAGIVRGDTFRPMPAGRQSLEDIKPKRSKLPRSKMTDIA